MAIEALLLYAGTFEDCHGTVVTITEQDLFAIAQANSGGEIPIREEHDASTTLEGSVFGDFEVREIMSGESLKDIAIGAKGLFAKKVETTLTELIGKSLSIGLSVRDFLLNEISRVNNPAVAGAVFFSQPSNGLFPSLLGREVVVQQQHGFVRELQGEKIVVEFKDGKTVVCAKHQVRKPRERILRLDFIRRTNR